MNWTIVIVSIVIFLFCLAINEFQFLNHKIQNIDLKLNTYTIQLQTISLKIDEITEESGLQEATKHTGRIEIYLPSKIGNSYASGSIISLKNNTYFLTNKHVVMDEDSACFRTILSIESYENPNPIIFDDYNISWFINQKTWP